MFKNIINLFKSQNRKKLKNDKNSIEIGSVLLLYYNGFYRCTVVDKRKVYAIQYLEKRNSDTFILKLLKHDSKNTTIYQYISTSKNYNFLFYMSTHSVEKIKIVTNADIDNLNII